MSIWGQIKHGVHHAAHEAGKLGHTAEHAAEDAVETVGDVEAIAERVAHGIIAEIVSESSRQLLQVLLQWAEGAVRGQHATVELPVAPPVVRVRVTIHLADKIDAIRRTAHHPPGSVGGWVKTLRELVEHDKVGLVGHLPLVGRVEASCPIGKLEHEAERLLKLAT